MHPQIIKEKMFYEKYVPQARSFMKLNAPQAKRIKQNAPHF